eukprot:TRINITY_DN9401_c0_g1_i1.p1 TRINITY_DN9401_c0_g1~~TRINITY_DN9401_c0_g1_i1.p1  ORF type:complete len:143 (+),score=44.61 TRINITY_DN9401_c0_g1_i1:49-429(+)
MAANSTDNNQQQSNPNQNPNQNQNQNPNPNQNQNPNPFMMFNPYMMNMGAMGQQQQQQQQQPQSQQQIQPQIIYRDQLSQLNSMGFTDADANIGALVATGGNVQAAIDRLLGEINFYCSYSNFPFF